jgi:hypothetical protein
MRLLRAGKLWFCSSGLFSFALVGTLILARKFILHKKTKPKVSMVLIAGFVFSLGMGRLMAEFAIDEYSKNYVGTGIHPGTPFAFFAIVSLPFAALSFSLALRAACGSADFDPPPTNMRSGWRRSGGRFQR